MTHRPPPMSLSGEFVAVVALDQSHHDDLFVATKDGDLHQLWYTMVPAPDQVAAEIDRRLAV